MKKNKEKQRKIKKKEKKQRNFYFFLSSCLRWHILSYFFLWIISFFLLQFHINRDGIVPRDIPCCTLILTLFQFLFSFISLFIFNLVVIIPKLPIIFVCGYLHGFVKILWYTLWFCKNLFSKEEYSRLLLVDPWDFLHTYVFTCFFHGLSLFFFFFFTIYTSIAFSLISIFFYQTHVVFCNEFCFVDLTLKYVYTYYQTCKVLMTVVENCVRKRIVVWVFFTFYV